MPSLPSPRGNFRYRYCASREVRPIVRGGLGLENPSATNARLFAGSQVEIRRWADESLAGESFQGLRAGGYIARYAGLSTAAHSSFAPDLATQSQDRQVGMDHDSVRPRTSSVVVCWICPTGVVI